MRARDRGESARRLLLALNVIHGAAKVWSLSDL
jgi:hypothetical protein